MNKKIVFVVGIIVVAGVIAFAWCSQKGTQPPKPAGTGQQTNQETGYHANCVNAKFPKGQELNISADPATGLVTVGYTDENGQQKETVLNYKSNDGFVGCSEDAKRVLTQVSDNEKGK